MGTIISSGGSKVNGLNNVKGFSAVTGTTVETVTGTLLIPRNSVKFDGTAELVVRTAKQGVSGTLGVAIYANGTPDLAGSPILIARHNAVAGTLFLQMERTLFVANASATYVAATTTSGVSDNTSFTNAGVLLSIDWTAQQYIVVGISNGSTADSSTGVGIVLKLF
jgi:hypothetical protein